MKKFVFNFGVLHHFVSKTAEFHHSIQNRSLHRTTPMAITGPSSFCLQSPAPRLLLRRGFPARGSLTYGAAAGSPSLLSLRAAGSLAHRPTRNALPSGARQVEKARGVAVARGADWGRRGCPSRSRTVPGGARWPVVPGGRWRWEAWGREAWVRESSVEDGGRPSAVVGGARWPAVGGGRRRWDRGSLGGGRRRFEHGPAKQKHVAMEQI